MNEAFPRNKLSTDDWWSKKKTEEKELLLGDMEDLFEELLYNVPLGSETVKNLYLVGIIMENTKMELAARKRAQNSKHMRRREFQYLDAFDDRGLIYSRLHGISI